ncbi:MAG TPA: TIGR03086 family metal-binding protein, partial [Thermomicrobiales bacterium]|nr:TIGR03086 family metal-binding protein [Thermomicrobiales bacterium]
MTHDRLRDDEPRSLAESAALDADASAGAPVNHPGARVLMVDAATGARGIVDHVQPDQWASPTPCTEWSVRQIVEHLIAGNERAATALVGPAPPSATVAGDDLAAAFGASWDRLQWAYQAPGALTATVDMPFGPMPAAFMAQIRAGDMLVHAWDIARATGQPTDYAPELNETMLALSRRMFATV